MAYPSDLTRTKNWGTEILTDADLESQLDLIINWVMAAFNQSTGHGHTGVANDGPILDIAILTIASQAAGDILYASSSSAWARLAKGTDGNFLKQASGVPSWAALAVSDMPAGSVVQVVNYQTGEVATGTTAIPLDDTIPQNTEGTEFMTLAITPKSTTNKLLITVTAHLSHSGDYQEVVAALFQDSIANALAVGRGETAVSGGTDIAPITFSYYMTAGTTSAITFKIRGGSSTGATITFNGAGGARKYGGVMMSSITITEIKA